MFWISFCCFFFFVWKNDATYTIWGMAWLELPMRVVVSCDKLGWGAYICWTQDCLMGLPNILLWVLFHFFVDWELAELKHLSRRRKRKKLFSISWVTASESGVGQTEFRLVICGRCGVIRFYFWTLYDKLNFAWNGWTVEGDSPVDYVYIWVFCIILE